MTATKTATTACLNCGRQFTARRKGHVFCSRKCRHRFEGQRVPPDPEAIARLFDPARDPKERVREDDWHPEDWDPNVSEGEGFRDLYWQDTVATRRKWYRTLQDDGNV